MINNNEDYEIYLLILTTLVIFLESVKKYTILLAGINLSYSIIILPFTFIVTNIITKKYNYKKTFFAIILSVLFLITFKALIAFSLGEKLLLSNLYKDIISYTISQIINLVIYCFLVKNTKRAYFSVLLNYLLSVVIFNMIYTLLSLSKITIELYLKEYFITLGIQLVICIIIAFFDRKILRKE